MFQFVIKRGLSDSLDLCGSIPINALTQVAHIEDIVYVINNIVFNLQKPLFIFGIFTLTCSCCSRSQIISLLLEVPGHCLPLFKFRELFESRYLTSISMSDMHKMKDVCLISEDSTGRMVILNPDHRNTPSPVFPTAQVNSVCVCVCVSSLTVMKDEFRVSY